MGASELEPDLDGQPGNAVVEQWPQAVGACQRRAGILAVSPRGARRAPSPRGRARSSSSRRDPSPRREPVPPARVAPPRPRLPRWPREARAVPAPRRRPRRCRWRAPLDGCCEVRPSARSVAPSNACATPRARSATGIQAALRRELIERQIGVRERLLDAVRHHVRPQRGDPGLDRRAAVRERDRRGRPVGEGEPPLGFLGPPRQHAEPGSVDGERRVLHELVVAEPREPLLHGLHAAVVVERQARASTRPATVSVSPAACP